MACSVEGCSKKILARQLCEAHYDRFRRYGTPLGGGPPYADKGAPAAFILQAIRETSDQCLLWPYAKDRKGYGKTTIKGKSFLAHRIVCEKIHGPAPLDKPEAAHSCGNGHIGCVNGRHLSWKDRRGNVEDMIRHGRSRLGHRWSRRQHDASA